MQEPQQALHVLQGSDYRTPGAGGIGGNVTFKLSRALSERVAAGKRVLPQAHLAATFNKPGFPVIDNYTYVICGDARWKVKHEVLPRWKESGGRPR